MYNYETNSDLVLEIFGDILRFFEISGLEKIVPIHVSTPI